MLGSLLILAGCSFTTSQTSAPGTDKDAVDVQSGTSNQATVFMPNHDGLLTPLTLPVTGTDVAALVAELVPAMAEGGAFEKAELLPTGFHSVLPRGTSVLASALDSESGVLTVNLSDKFVNYSENEERRIVEAMTWTLTELPGVQAVSLKVEGIPLTEMPVAGMPLDRQLTRPVLGINVEIASGVDVTHSMPVTTYFTSVAPDGQGYLVPVTRVVTRNAAPLRTVMQELIAGPLNANLLAPVSTPDIVVEDVVVDGDVVSVMLRDPAFTEGERMPADFMKATVLTMTEGGSHADMKVRVTVNGSSNIVDTHDQPYSTPVSRPTFVNVQKF